MKLEQKIERKVPELKPAPTVVEKVQELKPAPAVTEKVQELKPGPKASESERHVVVGSYVEPMNFENIVPPSPQWRRRPRRKDISSWAKEFSDRRRLMV